MNHTHVLMNRTTITKSEGIGTSFSNSPITDEMLNRIAEMAHQSNYRYVHEDMEEFATPSLYWGGDSADKLLLAT